MSQLRPGYRALVVGATGAIGSAWVAALQADPRCGEAIALSRKAGLSIDQFHSVIGAGRMRSPFYDTFMQWTLAGDENAHRFTISNAHKDMRYLASMATEIGAVNPLQSAVRNSFAAMEAAGEGDKYVPMLADYIAKVNGLS